MKPLAPRSFGLLDLVAVAVFALAPVLGLHGFGRAVSWTVAVALASLVAMTDYPLGLARALPLTANHALVAGTAVGLAFVAALYANAGMPAPRNFFLATSAALGALAAAGYFSATRRAAAEVREPRDREAATMLDDHAAART